MKILTLILGSVALLLLVIYLLYRILDGIYDRRVAAYQNKLLKMKWTRCTISTSQCGAGAMITTITCRP